VGSNLPTRDTEPLIQPSLLGTVIARDSTAFGPGGARMYVESILTGKGAEVATVEPGAAVRDAVAILRDRGVGALVVSTDGRAIDGILSERDIVRRLADHGDATLDMTVADVMTRTVTTCSSKDTVEQLMWVMTERRIRHLPVADANGALCGIVSIGDVVKSRLVHLESENQALHDYITHGR
jgi:CBS domain-containing protein